jgi:hypothetical protein
MAKVIITKNLEKEINKKFQNRSIQIIKLMYSLKENPKKGKIVGNVGGIIIKELKYEKFRFYFITDGYRIKLLKIEELNDLLIKFVAMSDKKSQGKVIEEIKNVLKSLGAEGF